jgi:hypothetical protein
VTERERERERERELSSQTGRITLRRKQKPSKPRDEINEGRMKQSSLFGHSRELTSALV